MNNGIGGSSPALSAGRDDRPRAGLGLAGSAQRFREHLSDPLFRNAYALLANTVGNSVFGIFYWVLAARYYSPAVVGASSALIAALLLISTVAQLNLGSALTRFLPKAGRRGSRLLLGAYAASAGFGLLIALAASSWTDGLLEAVGLRGGPGRLWLAGGVVVWALFALQDFALTGLRRAVWVPAENAVFGLLKIVVLTALAATAPDIGIFASWLVPMAFMLLPVNLLIFRSFSAARSGQPGSEEPLNPGRIGHFVALDYVGSLFNLAATHLLPVLIAARIGAEANAYFYIAWVVVSTLDFALISVTSSLTVEGAHREDNLPHLTRELGKRLLAGGSLVIAGMLIGAPYLLSIFGQGYSDRASGLLRLLALGLASRGVIILWLSALRVRKDARQILLVQACSSLAVLGLSAALIRSLGATGVGIAYLAGQTAVALAVLPGLLRLIRGTKETSPVEVRGVPAVQEETGAWAARRPPSAPVSELSVIVPARNAEGWLSECLAPIRASGPAEIIVVDGLSTDSTTHIAESFGARVISDGGRGLPVARALGAAAAKSRWVALVDADVVVGVDSLQRLLDEFLQGGYIGLQAGLHSVSGRGYWGRALVNHHHHGWSRKWFGLAATIFDRTELLKHGFDDDFLSGEDLELRRRLKDFGEPTGVSRRTVVTHRFNDDFAFAKNQWVSDGRGFARVMRKRGPDAWWLAGLPLASAAWGIGTSLLRLQPAWIPYYICFVVFNYSAMIKQLFSKRKPRESAPSFVSNNAPSSRTTR